MKGTILIEPAGTSKSYDLARELTEAKVELLLYNNMPYTVGQIIRVKCTINEVEHGMEFSLDPSDTITIGQALDYCIYKLPLQQNSQEGEK